jgi:hypothetical protein
MSLPRENSGHTAMETTDRVLAERRPKFQSYSVAGD